MLLFLLSICIANSLAQLSAPSCDSKIYCQGQLLDTIQLLQPYPDSKTFVDMKCKFDEKTILANFDKFMKDTSNKPTKDDALKFINENFEEGNELEDWTPTGYTKTPKILNRITNEDYKHFASDLVGIWPSLAKKVKKEVIDNPSLYSFLPVHEGFIIPGGRFREFYYWDSYWIIEGLIASDMHETVKGMLNNFLEIVDKYGFLPNGARVYYLNRSQPPLLTLMVNSYYQETKNKDWLKTKVNILDKELRFWLKNRLTTVTKDGQKYTLAHYNVPSGSPRPESYYEDVKTASIFSDDERKQELYADLKSGAETGWDFSSRWIVDDQGGNNANLSSLHTRRIIPVDLNSFLYQAFRKLSNFYEIVDPKNKNAHFWGQQANALQKSIDKVFYNKKDGIWYDWDNKLNKHRKIFYPSNFAPLWAGAVSDKKAFILGGKAVEYLIKKKILNYEGGIPTSLANTGEQWDAPNAWPPLQSIVILGLDKSGHPKAKRVAKQLAERWIVSNRIGFNQTNSMFEKYDAETPGKYGGGGEYTVQSGFGWTNGVIFELIKRFATVPTADDLQQAITKNGGYLF